MEMMSFLKKELDSSKMFPMVSDEKLETKTSRSKKTAVSVVFSSADKAEKYQKQIEKFLNHVLTDGDDFCCSTVQDEKYDAKKKKRLEAEQWKQNCLNDNRSPQMPLYDTTFDDTLEYSEINEEEVNYPETESQKMTCFNCLGDHHLNDCPEDHVASRIAINKRAVMENSQATIRYHTDDAQPLEKNGNICPGRISVNLRNALDLKTNQLPLYIYHMRILGYPPGWMKEAEVEHSGLSVYDSNGKAVEDESNSKDSSKRFNGVNFIEFPGFNTPLPEGYHDEWKQLRMMPMQSHQQLSEALKHACVMNSPNYKKRKNAQAETSDSDDNIKRQKGTDDVKEKKKTEESPMKSDTDSEKMDNVDERPSSVVVGSPLIDTGNPYKRLPDCSKFSADITEHLPYENLPDAVGAYDRKMRGVLDQVRLDMNRLLKKSPNK